ncbi:hypothetical protein NMG60_11006769 [Bertholletia excelsa]
MGRQPCCDKVGLKRGPWTIEEDHKLMNFILHNGIQCWRMVPKLAGLLRCGKSCRLRWINYLRPDLKRGAFSESEEDQIIQLHARLGNRWSKIASHFPGRTDNEIKNHWNTRIKKRLKLQGLDPITHQPLEQIEKAEEKTETPPDQHKSISTQEKVQNPEINEKQKEARILSLDETADLLNNYDMFYGNIGVGLWMNQEAAATSTSYSPSFSLEDSLNNLSCSMAESSPIQQESMQHSHLLQVNGRNPYGTQPSALTIVQYLKSSLLLQPASWS